MLRLRFARVASMGAVLLSLVTVAAAHAEPPSTNLLQNPGFEDARPHHGWMPAGWDTSEAGLPSVFFGRDTFVVHSGRYAVNVANLSMLYPMWHNWSQTILVTPQMWGKDLVFSVWTRSNGLQGRAYILAQVYRDSIGKMAKTWGVDRDEAGERLNIKKIDDPLIDLGWKRQYFDEPETDWVQRQVRVFVAPTTNIVYVRCGILGSGQVIFDDASLTLEPAKAPDPLPLRTNLIADPGFEGDGNTWEYVMPPYEGIRVDRDTTVAHSGKASVHCEGGLTGLISTRSGVCQEFCNRALGGKRVKLSGYIRTDSLRGRAYISLYYHTLHGMVPGPVAPQFSMNTPWTLTSIEGDVPPDTYAVWAWFMYEAPAPGRVYYDDCSFEVVGDAAPEKPRRPTPRTPGTRPAGVKSGSGRTRITP